MNTANSLEQLCLTIGHDFKEPSILLTALTHKSASKMSGGPHSYNNERLEFLGDAVLSLVTAEFLFRHNRHFNEGELSRLRSQFVCKENLSLAAERILLSKYLLSDKAMRSSGSNNSPSVRSDALEALIGAVFLDAGLDQARAMIFKVLGEPPLNLLEIDKDAKTRLQERVQAHLQKAPHYELLEKKGPAHAPTFVVGVKIDNELVASAIGENKKTAAQNAAFLALRVLDERLDQTPNAPHVS